MTTTATPATVADLKPGDHFHYDTDTWCLDLSSMRRHDVVDRTEGIVVEVRPAEASYYTMTGADPAEVRVEVRCYTPRAKESNDRRIARGERPRPPQSMYLPLTRPIIIH